MNVDTDRDVGEYDYPEDEAERHRRLRAWFGAGRPEWVDNSLYVGGAPGDFLATHADEDGRSYVAYVTYEEEYKGWIASDDPECGSYLKTEDEGGEYELLFDTAEMAMVEIDARVPSLIENRLRGIAEATVETIDKECDFFRDELLPMPDDEAVDYLVRAYWERGGFVLPIEEEDRTMITKKRAMEAFSAEEDRQAEVLEARCDMALSKYEGEPALPQNPSHGGRSISDLLVGQGTGSTFEAKPGGAHHRLRERVEARGVARDGALHRRGARLDRTVQRSCRSQWPVHPRVLVSALERGHAIVVTALAAEHGNVTRAAKRLGVTRQQATKLVKRYGFLALAQELRDERERVCAEAMPAAVAPEDPDFLEVPPECRAADRGVNEALETVRERFNSLLNEYETLLSDARDARDGNTLSTRDLLAAIRLVLRHLPRNYEREILVKAVRSYAGSLTLYEQDALLTECGVSPDAPYDCMVAWAAAVDENGDAPEERT